jgi:hypothetical protein
MKITSGRRRKTYPDRRTHSQINSSLNTLRKWFFVTNNSAPSPKSLWSVALTNALRCRRTVSVCVFKRAKRSRFAYFALKLALIPLTRPSGTGSIWKSSVTGAEAPAYSQAVPPDFAKASSGRPGRYV